MKDNNIQYRIPLLFRLHMCAFCTLSSHTSLNNCVAIIAFIATYSWRIWNINKIMHVLQMVTGSISALAVNPLSLYEHCPQLGKLGMKMSVLKPYGKYGWKFGEIQKDTLSPCYSFSCSELGSPQVSSLFLGYIPSYLLPFIQECLNNQEYWFHGAQDIWANPYPIILLFILS